MNLFFEVLEKSARRNPNKTALLFGDESITYGDLFAETARWANAFRELVVRV